MSAGMVVGDVMWWARVVNGNVDTQAVMILDFPGSMLVVEDERGARVSLRACDVSAVCMARTRHEALGLLRANRGRHLVVLRADVERARLARLEEERRVEAEERVISEIDAAMSACAHGGAA